MSPKGPYPVPGETFLLLDDLLVAADLHIGIERTLAARGFTFPSGTDELVERIISQEGKELLILGDLKDTVAHTPEGLAAELYGALSELNERFSEVTLVRGNHDGGIPESILSMMNVEREWGVIRNGVSFIHGHTTIPADSPLLENELLVMGHTHPRVTFIDHLQRGSHETCWARFPVREGTLGRIREVIVMPASNPLCGGASVNRRGERLLGPLLRDDVIRRDKGRLTLLDGTDIGVVGDLYF